MWLAGDPAAVIHALVEYGQFIALLLSLFVVSGGVYVAGDLKARPEVNVVFLVIGAVAAATGKPLASLGLRVIRLERYLPLRWSTAVATVFVGTFSHVLLDSFIYDDMTPLQPFSNASPLLDMASMDAVLAFCVIAGGVGAAALFLVNGRRGTSD